MKKRDFTPWPMIATGRADAKCVATEPRSLREAQVHHVEVARVDADDLAGAVVPLARDHAVDDDLAARRRRRRGSSP